MGRKRIGMVGVGQSPRSDTLPGMIEVLGKDVEIIEKGALDGLTRKEIQSLYPKEGMYPICTRLVDASQVTVGKQELIPRVQAKIEELNQEGVELIVLLCTGHFPKFTSRCLLVEAERVVNRCTEALVSDYHTMGFMVPLPEQVESARKEFSYLTPHIVVVSASPYKPREEMLQAAETLREGKVDLVIMHCMGYTKEHKRIIREITGKPALQANTMVAHTVAELLGPPTFP